MVKLDYALKQFEDYCKNYPDLPEIRLKKEHMLRVVKNSMSIAKGLGLNEEDIQLAGLIALIHDIGRFEQQKVYHTFVDRESIDHAQYSSVQLFQKGLIRFFIEDEQYDNIIQKAVLNHNRFEVEKGLEDRELLHAQIIRDADKIDIYNQVLMSDASLVFDGKWPEPNDEISPLVLDSFKRKECVKTADMQTKLDDYVRKCALIFGFYYPEISLKMVKENDSISKLRVHFLNTFLIENAHTLQEMQEVEDSSIAFINDSILSALKK